MEPPSAEECVNVYVNLDSKPKAGVEIPIACECCGMPLFISEEDLVLIKREQMKNLCILCIALLTQGRRDMYTVGGLIKNGQVELKRTDA